MKNLKDSIRKRSLDELAYEAKKRVSQAEYGCYNVWYWVGSTIRKKNRGVENCLLYIKQRFKRQRNQW